MSDYQPNKIIPGTVYQVIQLLGQGGMGTVYEVEDTTVGKRYVLKTLHAALRDRKELAERLHKEARTLARLSHPNIVEVVTAGMTADALKLPYFVMQKLNGHTLRSVLHAKGGLPLETAYSIAIDLLDALDHAHAIGVIHRDVKPENIFLHCGPNEAHQTKLLDFGVMRIMSTDRSQTGARFVGTIRYAPPEQLRGGHVTPRTDLYAAGLVLYEMIAGAGPFDDEANDRAIAKAHMDKNAPPLATRATVPPALDALLVSALAKDPDARPRDAFTFASQLRALSREAASARGSSPSYGSVDAVIGGLHKTPSPTNLNDSTRGRTPRVPDAALENAGRRTPMPQATMRMDPQRAAREATTTGATESFAERHALGKRAWLAVGATVVALALAGVAAGARWTKGRTPAPASAAATPAATATPTATPTSTSNPTATPTATPTPTPTPTPAPPPRVRRSPQPAPRPASTTTPKSRLPPSDL